MGETFRSRRSQVRLPGCSASSVAGLLKPPFLGCETRGHSSSLPQHSVSLSLPVGFPHRSSWGNRASLLNQMTSPSSGLTEH